MKKKVLMLGAGLAIGSALVVTSAFADIGGAKGYEAYKSALKNTAAATSSTQNVALTIRDNGSELLNVKTTVKENETIGSVSGQAAIQAGSTSQTFDFYDLKDKQVFKAGNSDTYYVTTESERRHWKEKADEHKNDPALSKEMENVVDALVGNLKNYVNVSNAEGGSQTIDAKLTGSQIPAAANVIGSILVKEALSGKHAQDELDQQEQFGHNMLGVNVKQITGTLPKLTQNVNIDEVALHATIDSNNYITGQQIDFTISGKDASGQAHKVVITADIATSNLNATTPDSIDLAGKKVTTIQEREFKH
ncbi:hypothetical protein E5161_09375 [Cohnella pontilimi]|uniref:Uncharacterized protein n=1 Tax=Cohnella pontilimi TaxID=2564100 RepID=A0A4U0FBW2_9BACL|nr:hypothetical protein [Cohnella pontilimi]TJY42210.1 hypothetical protein E5161_09375 [Cohnella pontilimi]